MQAFSDRGDADEQHRQAGPRGPILGRREEDRRIEAIRVAQQLLARKALGDEGLDDELGRTEQVVGELVFLLLVAQDRLVVGVLVAAAAGRPRSACTPRRRLVGKARVRVWALEDRRDPKAPRRLQRPQGAERPDVDDVGSIRQPGERASDDRVVKAEAATPA